MNFLSNKPVDRVPIAFFHHFCDWDVFCTGVENKAAFEQNIEGHRLAKAIFDPDVAKVMNDSLMLMPVDVSFVKEVSDFRKIEPIATDSPFFQKTLELTKRVRDFYDAETPVYVTGFSPLMVLNNSIAGGFLGGDGQKLFPRYMQEDPESMSCAMGILAERIADLHHLLLTEGGADGLYFSVNNRNNLLAEDVYRTYVAPQEKEIMAKANKLSQINMLHICGFAGSANNLSLYTDYDAAAFNWAVHAEGVSLSEGKKLFGGKPVCGGFEQTKDSVIYKGTREEIEAAVYQILDDSGQIGVMLGADCTVPTDIDDHRFEWVRQAAIRYASEK